MPLSLANQHLLATNAEFIIRVRQAMATKALAVMTEITADPDEFTARLNLARRVLNDPHGVAQRASFILATADGIENVIQNANPATIADQHYNTFVSNNWSALAGYNMNYQEPA